MYNRVERKTYCLCMTCGGREHPIHESFTPSQQIGTTITNEIGRVYTPRLGVVNSDYVSILEDYPFTK